MNSTTGDFSEIRKSTPNDTFYNRGSLTTVKRNSRKYLNLRPLNLMGIKKEIEDDGKQIYPLDLVISDDKENQEKVVEVEEDSSEISHKDTSSSVEESYILPQKISSNNSLKDINYSKSKCERNLHEDTEKFTSQPCTSLNFGSQVKDNISLVKEHKNDSFDLDFSVLSLSTPVKQQINVNPNLNAVKSEHRNGRFQHQFLTPRINTSSLLKNQYSLKKPSLKTPLSSCNNNYARNKQPLRVLPTVPEKQVASKSADNEDITFPKDILSTPTHVPVKLVHEDPVYSVPINIPRDDTFQRMKVNDTEYIVVNLIGKGGSSEVYQCYSLESKLLVAIKCVSLQNPASANDYINEVKLLQHLQSCDKIIKMYDFEVSETQKKLFVVLENGGKDLSSILKQLAGQKSHIPMYMLLFYWMEMLYAVKQIHSNGIIHSDLKPANFLKVDEGLKLIDFGIASSVQSDMTSVFKTKQEGSCNYISPEALNSDSTNLGKSNSEKYKIHFKSDVWSLGCILYQFVYRRTPFQHITQLWLKLAAIMNPEYQIEYPEVDWVSSKIIKTIKKCLQYNVKSRPSVDELIQEYETILNNI